MILVIGQSFLRKKEYKNTLVRKKDNKSKVSKEDRKAERSKKPEMRFTGDKIEKKINNYNKCHGNIYLFQQ